MSEIAADQAPDRKRFIATLIGFSAVLMWALLALFTAASGTVPPFQLSAMCFAIGAAIGYQYREEAFKNTPASAAQAGNAFIGQGDLEPVVTGGREIDAFFAPLETGPLTFLETN